MKAFQQCAVAEAGVEFLKEQRQLRLRLIEGATENPLPLKMLLEMLHVHKLILGMLAEVLHGQKLAQVNVQLK